jgi:hypothetical protein
MSGRTSRSSAIAAPIVVFAFLAATTGAVAAPAVVEGKVTAEAGQLPPGCTMRLTGLGTEKVTAKAPIGPDGTYRLADLPAGHYQFEVVDPTGKVLSTRRFMVEAGRPNTVDLVVGKAAPAASRPGKRGDNWCRRNPEKCWAIVGGSVAASTVALLSLCDDPDASPAKRSCFD